MEEFEGTAGIGRVPKGGSCERRQVFVSWDRSARLQSEREAACRRLTPIVRKGVTETSA